MNRVGLIEDNIDYREEVAFTLRLAGFEIVLQSDGRDLDAQLEQTPCDLLLLDLGLPDEDGLAIARRLRQQQPALGIVMLTARADLKDRLAGLQEGADAYLVKPVDFRELIATLQSLQRRLRGLAVEAPVIWVLRENLLLLIDPQGQPIQLTPTETQLLAVLAHYAPEVAPRVALVTALGQDAKDFDYRRLELAISRLRRKIQPQDAQDSIIRAVRNKGYLFAAPIKTQAS